MAQPALRRGKALLAGSEQVSSSPALTQKSALPQAPHELSHLPRSVSDRAL